MNIELQEKMQPHIKALYARACEVLPRSLMMSDRYFEAKKCARLAEICDESDKIIQNVQRKLLSRLLKNALKNVPYYKREVKIDPDLVEPDNAVEILQKFPFLDKQEIMKNPLDFVSRSLSNHFLIYTTTGGSTGKGVGMWKRYDEFQACTAFIENIWGRFGYDRESRVLRMGSDGIAPLEKPPFRIKGRKLLVSPRHLSERWLPEIVDKMEEFEPDFIHCYPSCLEVLAGYLRENGRSLRVKGIFLASEEIRPEQLDFFKQVFGAPICFHYGANENVLLGHGCYDGERVCYHLNPLYGFAENLVDDCGHELIGTGLWSEAMPLIKYRTQDYGKIEETSAKCKVCGRSWRTVFQLDGRKQYYLTTRHGTKFSALSISCGVDKFIWDYVSNFQFVQNKPGEIELHIIPRNKLTPEVEARIIEAQRKRLAEWFEPINLVKETEIPLTTSGKRRLVVVNTGQNT